MDLAKYELERMYNIATYINKDKTKDKEYVGRIKKYLIYVELFKDETGRIFYTERAVE